MQENFAEAKIKLTTNLKENKVDCCSKFVQNLFPVLQNKSPNYHMTLNQKYCLQPQGFFSLFEEMDFVSNHNVSQKLVAMKSLLPSIFIDARKYLLTCYDKQRCTNFVHGFITGARRCIDDSSDFEIEEAFQKFCVFCLACKDNNFITFDESVVQLIVSIFTQLNSFSIDGLQLLRNIPILESAEKYDYRRLVIVYKPSKTVLDATVSTGQWISFSFYVFPIVQFPAFQVKSNFQAEKASFVKLKLEYNKPSNMWWLPNLHASTFSHLLKYELQGKTSVHNVIEALLPLRVSIFYIALTTVVFSK